MAQKNKQENKNKGPFNYFCYVDHTHIVHSETELTNEAAAAIAFQQLIQLAYKGKLKWHIEKETPRHPYCATCGAFIHNAEDEKQHKNIVVPTKQTPLSTPATDAPTINRDAITLYIQNGGCHCPFCNAPDIEGNEINVDTGIAWQEMKCNRCGNTWHDQYKLINVEAR